MIVEAGQTKSEGIPGRASDQELWGCEVGRFIAAGAGVRLTEQVGGAPDATGVFVCRERCLNHGLAREELLSVRPIIGMARPGSGLTPCCAFFALVDCDPASAGDHDLEGLAELDERRDRVDRALRAGAVAAGAVGGDVDDIGSAVRGPRRVVKTPGSPG